MDSITMAMIVVTIAVYIARYAVKTQGADILCGVIAACTTMLIIQDTSIPTDQLILFVLPTITVLLMTFIHIAFGKSKGIY